MNSSSKFPRARNGLYRLAIGAATIIGSFACELAAQNSSMVAVEAGDPARPALVVNGGDDRGPRPAVIVLHGGGGSAEMIRNASGFDDVALANDFLAVYGQGTEYAEGRRAWNTGFLGREEIQQVDDIGYLDNLIDELTGNHGADPGRIFMTGVSNGGMMTLRYAAARAERLAAATAVAAAMFTFDERPSRPLPILFIHGDLDQEVPPEGGWSKSLLVRANQLAPYKSLTNTVGFWEESNRSLPDQRIEAAGSLITTTHPAGAAGVVTRLLLDTNGGHGWPGRESPRPENPTLAAGLSGATYIWEFFEEQMAEPPQVEPAEPLLQRDQDGGLNSLDILLSWETRTEQQYTIEVSNDLRDWRFLPRYEDGTGERTAWRIPLKDTREFFRIVEARKSVDDWLTDAADTVLADYRILRSEAAGRPVSFHVYLPTTYTTQPDRRFPVLYWLHGSGPGVVGIPWLSHYFHTAIEEGRIPPMIVVFPNGLPQGMWCDSKNGLTPIESIVIDELIPHIDATLRTIPTREGRIIEGFSMGGYGAGRLGLKYPDMFRAFSMFGAGPLQLDFLEENPAFIVPIGTRQRIFAKVYGGDSAYFEAQSPWRLAEEAAAGNRLGSIRIRQIVGSLDSLAPPNRDLHEHLLSLGIAHEYREIPGVGHNTSQLLQALGIDNWNFYQDEFGPDDS